MPTAEDGKGAAMVRLVMRFDLRAPEHGTPHAEQYAACLDFASWADEHGFGACALSEHHASDDGWNPSPITLAAAIAGRTQRLRIMLAALLAPLYDPVKLAEDLAVLDLVSGGRATTVLGLGYRDAEYAMFGVDRRQRVALLEQCVEAIRLAWTGEPFEWRGRAVRMATRPISAGPPIMIGGGVAASARRAARLALPFMPMNSDPALVRVYEEECERLNVQGFCASGIGHTFVHVAEDPERAWETIGPYALEEARTYGGWQPPGQLSEADAPSSTLDELRASGVYQVLTPEQSVRFAAEAGGLVFHPLMGGLPVDFSWESLRLFEAEVLPRLRDR